jgi:predicted AlkP superfamily pyrophosphatase or phosphodiesterase
MIARLTLMLRKWLLVAALAFSLAAQTPPGAAPAPAKPKPAAARSVTATLRTPKLVLAIVIDQFRYDYLTRFKADYTSGLKRLMEQGSVFTNAYYEHALTVTAVGHSTFLTGASPATSGIIGNDWYDRTTRKRVTSVTRLDDSDKGARLVGATGPGATPERMLQTTIGDELKMSGKGGKVIGISIKDRSAILPVGRMADAAYWFDDASGNFVSSSYFFPTNELPAWVSELNKSRPGDKFAGVEWMGHKAPTSAGRSLYAELASTPWGNELIQKATLGALAAEKLGTSEKVDLLAVSYSSNDYVGHRYGPDSPEVRDMAIRVDKLIGELLAAAELQVGAGRVLVALTADHGVAPVPETNVQRRMLGGRLSIQPIRAAVEQALKARFGGGTWIADMLFDGGIYFTPDPIPGKAIDRAEMERVAADVIRTQPHVFRAYTRSQLISGAYLMDRVGKQVGNGFNETRSPDLTVVFDSFYLPGGGGGTNHGTPYGYDAHVPMIFFGPGVRTGKFNGNVAVNDIAPTLATLLEIETPSGSVGRALDEIIR